MRVVGYCARCPLHADPLADVRGRQCPWGCKAAKHEQPPYEIHPHGIVAGGHGVMCPKCGNVSSVELQVLDMLVSCPNRTSTVQGNKDFIFLVKGTGPWIRKWLTWMRLPSRVKAERRLSKLRP